MAGGSLIVVGIGLKLSQQCTPEARFAIESADVVFAAVADPLAQRWLETLNRNTISLQPLYQRRSTRADTYEAMVATIMEGVRAGKRVCGAFYGHPGVIVTPSHEAVRRARAEGFRAEMLPGVSAEDCLYADLGIDPGALGAQCYEATDFLVNARKIDTTAALVLWQIALAGDLSLSILEPDRERVRLLADILQETYPSEHEVIVYEAATLPVTGPDIQRLPLCELHRARISQSSTLYAPPLQSPTPSPERLALLRSRFQ